MCDDNILAMQYKLMCTTQDWSPPEGLFDWHVDEEDKVVFPYGEPKPCKPIPMKNVKDIIKGIEDFI